MVKLLDALNFFDDIHKSPESDTTGQNLQIRASNNQQKSKIGRNFIDDLSFFDEVRNNQKSENKKRSGVEDTSDDGLKAHDQSTLEALASLKPGSKAKQMDFTTLKKDFMYLQAKFYQAIVSGDNKTALKLAPLLNLFGGDDMGYGVVTKGRAH